MAIKNIADIWRLELDGLSKWDQECGEELHASCTLTVIGTKFLT